MLPLWYRNPFVCYIFMTIQVVVNGKILSATCSQKMQIQNGRAEERQIVLASH
jgi:hypothetical protein